MDAERWARLEALCAAAHKMPAGDRAEFLNAQCAGDAPLRREVEDLLTSLDQCDGFLDGPPAEVGALLAQSLADLDPPEKVGPYRIVRSLGRGGMGDVFLAQEERDDFRQPVALKLVRPGLDSHDILRRFHQERQILANLKHPNIARLLTAGTTEAGRPYFVMEYIEGEPIDEYCRLRGLSVHERLRLMDTVCRALHHAHQNLVIHRDLKPSNILVTADGRPVVLDFGIGKVLDHEAHRGAGTETQVGSQPLTPEYAAPEQLRGDPVTTVTDVYGLGVLLYELLTGERPYRMSGRTRQEFEEALRQTDPTAPSIVLRRASRSTKRADTGSEFGGVRTVDADLDTIVLKALRTEPLDRYASAIELADDVERYLTGHPVRARPQALSYRIGKFIRRHRVGVAAAVTVAAALIGTTAYALQQTRRVAVERDRALEVRGFLLETFGAGGPDQAVGDSVTARALLDGQAGALSGAYDAEPALKADMMTVLAEGYDRLGLFEEAETWARQALNLRQQILPAGDIDIAVAQNVLGWIRHQRGASEEAEGLLRGAVQTARRSPRGGDRALSRALNDLGVVLESRGEYDEAGELHVEALAIRTDLLGPRHRSVGVSASNLSVVYYRKGRYADAVDLARQGLDVFTAAVGPDHQRTAVVAHNLASFQLMMGDWEGAEQQYRALLDRQTARFGKAHPLVINLMVDITNVLEGQERWSEAYTLAEETLELQERTLGPEHPGVAKTLLALGDIAASEGDSADAFRLADRALALRRRVYGEESEMVAETLYLMAIMYSRLEMLEQAVPLYRDAHRITERVLGPEHPKTATQLGRLATALSRLDRHQDAFPHMTAAHGTLRQAFADDHPQVQSTRLWLASIHVGLASYDLADSLLTVAAGELKTAADSTRFAQFITLVRDRLEARR